MDKKKYDRKKYKRDIAKETAWQKIKYRRFGFAVDRLKGEKFIEVLNKAGKTPLQWFKEQVENVITDTVAVDKAGKTNTVTAPKVGNRNRPYPTDEMIDKWVELRKEGQSFRAIASGPDSHGYVQSTIFKCVKVKGG